MNFTYGQRETEYLMKKDKRLAAVIRQVGHVEREIDPDLFSAVVHHIVGQQISTKAQATIWKRMQEQLHKVDAAQLLAVPAEELQKCGISYRKVEYIRDFAKKVSTGSLDLDALWEMPDADAIRTLSSLKGIGIWTAEMILLFCMERPDIFSFDDLAIRRGLRMLYRHSTIDRERFEQYRRRFSPYGSIASLYLWAVAGGAINGLDDPAVKPRRRKSTSAKR